MHLILIVPAVLLFLLGGAFLRQSLSDMHIDNIFTGIFTVSLGFLLGALVVTPLTFLGIAALTFAAYWYLDQNGLFDLLFKNL